jgi:hypothetical protein
MQTYVHPLPLSFLARAHTLYIHTSHLRTKTLRSSPPWAPLTALTSGVSERAVTPLSPSALPIPAAYESVGCCTVGDSVVGGGLLLCVRQSVHNHMRMFSIDKERFVQQDVCMHACV